MVTKLFITFAHRMRRLLHIYYEMRKICMSLTATIVVWLFGACANEVKDISLADAAYEAWVNDSSLIKMAVMPTLDCLPLYVAAEHGMFERHGASVSLYPYDAQMDCDTALKDGWVNAMATDLVRAERLKSQGMKLTYLTATDLHWQLVASKMARIKRLNQIEHKMVAMTRYSATAMLVDNLVDTVKVDNDHVFRVQVNDLGVRLSMLENQVMDLLLLPEPQATAARELDANVLYDTRQNDIAMGVVVLNDTTIADTTLCKRQVEAFLKAYDEACDSINNRGILFYRDVIMNRCKVKPAIVDSIPSDYQFSPSHLPLQKDVDRAEKWLKREKK